MNMRPVTVMIAFAFTLTALEGCNTACRRPFSATCPRCAPCDPCAPRSGGGFLPPPQPVSPAQIAPVGVPAPAATFQPPPSPPAPAFQPPAAADARSLSSPAPPTQYAWYPPQHNGARLTPPETIYPDPAGEPGRVRLQPPPSSEPPLAERANPEPAVTEAPPAVKLQPMTPEPPPAVKLQPGITEERAATPSLPVGIPQFAGVKDRVTRGLRPSLEGFEWLKANGYRTVLHVRSPREVESADQKVVEKQGLKYMTLTVSPETLANALSQFNRAVEETSNLPLFVYDKDGLLTGSLWYLHFRTVERLDDTAARRKAATLGLKEETSGEAGTLWLAIQEYLRKTTP